MPELMVGRAWRLGRRAPATCVQAFLFFPAGQDTPPASQSRSPSGWPAAARHTRFVLSLWVGRLVYALRTRETEHLDLSQVVERGKREPRKGDGPRKGGGATYLKQLMKNEKLYTLYTSSSPPTPPPTRP